MKKKVVSALLCATMVATMFAGCGSKESDNNASTPDTSKADTSSEVSEPAVKGEYVGCHPCINTSSLRVRTADLMEKIIPAMHHEAKIIQI